VEACSNHLNNEIYIDPITEHEDTEMPEFNEQVDQCKDPA
jgi:hypothetical protein